MVMTVADIILRCNGVYHNNLSMVYTRSVWQPLSQPLAYVAIKLQVAEASDDDQRFELQVKSQELVEYS